jgi:hypothetical protein
MVVIGSPIDRQHAYVLDKFISSQVLIQKAYPNSILVMATSEKDYAPELVKKLNAAGLTARVLTHTAEKPPGARHWIWDVVSGREAIRCFAVSQPEADLLFFLDADTLCPADSVSRLIVNMSGFDVVYNGYALRQGGTGLAGAGCVMMRRPIFERIVFRCVEFSGGDVVFEDNLLEMDLFTMRARVKKGFFIAIDHYQSAIDYQHTSAQQLGRMRALINRPLLRFLLIKVSLALRVNIPWRLKLFIGKFTAGRGS